MIKKSIIFIFTLVILASCVSPKVYKDLEAKYADLKQENRKLSSDYEELMKAKGYLDKIL